MNVIIAAVIGGILLLWGGIIGFLKVIDLFERKHILFLGIYTTLIAGSVMGLVLYTNYERQKENRRELQNQMDEFSKRLGELSDKLVAQLEEKANLTASEFEIRAKLQHKTKEYEESQANLLAQEEEYRALKQSLDRELAHQKQYQAEINQKMQERFQQEEARYREEDERYKGIQAFLDAHKRSLETAQKQLSVLQDDLSRLNNQTAALQKTQTGLVTKVDANGKIIEQQGKDLAQKLEALTRNQAAFQDDMNEINAQIDSLYLWRKK